MRYDYGNMFGWIKGMPRFWVERRNGCIAVCDSSLRVDLPADLKKDTYGVTWFKEGGTCSDTCGNCGHSHSEYYVPEDTVQEAVRKADELNNGRSGAIGDAG